METNLSKYIDDKELVARAKSGDLSAFEEIVQKYKSMMAKVIIGMVGNKQDAEDIGQEAFIRFYKSLHQYNGEASLSTYLTRIAINLSINELKKQRSRKWLSLESKHEQFYAVDRTDKQRDEKEIIDKALSQLESKYKSVVVLRLIQGFSTKETAEILKLPLGTVLSRLARGQEKLKNIITQMEK